MNPLNSESTVSFRVPINFSGKNNNNNKLCMRLQSLKKGKFSDYNSIS